MRTIVFGPVTHKDKSYAYALGFGSVMMGMRFTDNPYRSLEYAAKNADWEEGYRAGLVASDKAIEDFIAEHKMEKTV